MGLRIHLVAPGGGPACGAGGRRGQWRGHQSKGVLASHILALVDCRKCQYTDQYRQLLNPSRQYRLRLFAMIENRDPPRRLRPADISTDPVYHKVEVVLDGEPVDFVSYDAEAGWVERYRIVRGRPVIEGEKFATERVAGVVEVRWKRAA